MARTVGIIVIVTLAVIMELFLARWVARDAEGRGMNPLRWGLFVFSSTFIGLAIYPWIRPKSFEI